MGLLSETLVPHRDHAGPAGCSPCCTPAACCRIGVLQRLDDIIYDARLRATMPRTLDERIVIVDIDEKSLAEVGRWPWGRNRLAELVDELFERQKIALRRLRRGVRRARRELGPQAPAPAGPGGAEGPARLRREARRSCRPASTTTPPSPGRCTSAPWCWATTSPATATAAPPACCPAPVMPQGSPARAADQVHQLERLRRQHRAAGARRRRWRGFFNPIVDARRRGARGAAAGRIQGPVLRVAGAGDVPGADRACRRWSRAFRRSASCRATSGLDSIRLRLGEQALAVPVAEGVTTLVPFRGPGGAAAARSVRLGGRRARQAPAAPASLKDKIVLVGTTAPGPAGPARHAGGRGLRRASRRTPTSSPACWTTGSPSSPTTRSATTW